MQDRKNEGELVLPKTFDECPTCGSTRRFCVEALRDEGMPEKELEEHKPILQASELITQVPGKLLPVKLMALMDVCVNCGTLYAIHLLKTDIQPPPLDTDGGHRGGGPLGPGRW